MTKGASLARVACPASDLWPRSDGTPIDCREKLRVLRENHGELAQSLRDCFDDAVLMGVDPAAMRQTLHALVDALRDPRREPSDNA